MKKWIIIVLIAYCQTGLAQRSHTDSIIARVNALPDNDQQFQALDQLFDGLNDYAGLQKKAAESLSLLQKLGQPKKQEKLLFFMAKAEFNFTDLPSALATCLQGVQLSQNLKDTTYTVQFLRGLAKVYGTMRETERSFNYSYKALNISRQQKDTLAILNVISNIETSYADVNKIDSARIMAAMEYHIVLQSKNKKIQDFIGYVYGDLGEAQSVSNHPDSALLYYYKALPVLIKTNNFTILAYTYNLIAKTYLKVSRPDSALKYALEGYRLSKQIKQSTWAADAAFILSQLYEGKEDTKSLFYYKAAIAAKDSISGGDKANRFQTIIYAEQHRQEELQNAAASYNNKVRFLAVIGVLLLVAIIGLLLFITNKKQRKVNKLLSKQNEEIEAQAKEAQIEAALEKVRSCALGMRQRADMLDICRMISGQLETLQISEIRNVQTAIIYTEKGIYINYEYYRLYNKTFITEVDYSHPIQADFVKKMLEEGGCQTLSLEGDELKNWFEYQKNTNQFPDPHLAEASSLNYYWFSIGPVALGISLYAPLNPADVNLFKRFLDVFRLAYRRYADIELAEAQAREAKIEAALERVRSRTMAMQKSEELKEVIQLVYDQFVHLNINVEHTGFILDYKERDDMHIWLADKHEIPSELIIPYFNSPHWNNFIEAKEKRLDFFINYLNFEEKNKFYQELFELFPGGPVSDETKECYLNCPGLAISTALLDNIGLYIENFSGTPYTDDENKTLTRFGKVFQQTYTRFLDLQKAEAQSKESKIELALERVRARTMAMHKSDELPETSALLFQQLKELGETSIQNSIAIVNEGAGFVELSTSIHGSYLLRTLYVPIDEPYLMAKAVKAWKAKSKSLTVKFEGRELKKYNELRNSFLETKVNFPEDQWIVNISFFSKGWLSFSSDKNVSDDIIAVLKRFASVFDQTYTRFLDLQTAEAQAIQAKQDLILLRTEKKRAEDALTKLKATQTQLVQKEKMASLGELTAGIAHEIQNPLNFVNNFSEVNIELIDEMHQEIDKGDYKEVKAIANDIKENQQKISQHGKRADFIVKGMLQHSRTSTGERQLTNINLLADEFFKLSYHGLRAKDKSFNADLVTNFDDDLPKVNIVQQDIGRVLLNLFNNAFYAVNQKNKTAEPDFKPKVEVTTSAKNGIVEISVKDNGNGIPKTIKDKIMQPFFTTKPTGEGTGLGLSLSYDIVVKGHGGNINIKSIEGEGSEFIITLPA